MQVNQDLDIHIYYIKSYAEGKVVLSTPLMESVMEGKAGDGASTSASTQGLQQETFTHSLVIQPKHLLRDWRPQSLDELTTEDVQQLAALSPEVVIIGTGEKLTWPDRALLRPLIDANIGYEIMDTAAACRTYNILSYEGRDIAAVLFI